jgi:hypothetical protein
MRILNDRVYGQKYMHVLNCSPTKNYIIITATILVNITAKNQLNDRNG